MSLGAMAAMPTSTFRPAFMLGELTALQFELHGADEASCGRATPARLARPVVSCCWSKPFLGISGSAGVRLGAITLLAAAAGSARATPLPIVATSAPVTSAALKRPLMPSLLGRKLLLSPR